MLGATIGMTDKDIEDQVDRMLEELRRRPSLREQAEDLMLHVDWLTDAEFSTQPQTVSNSGGTPPSASLLSTRSIAEDEMGPERRHAETTAGFASETRWDNLVGEALALGNACARAGDERIGLRLALHIACKVLNAHSGNSGPKLAEALMPLHRALDELDHGVTHSMFIPAARVAGRPRDSKRIRLFKLRCIMLGDALVEDGMRAAKANAEVAYCAAEMAARLFGPRPGYPFSAATVKRWRKDFSARWKAEAKSRSKRDFSVEDAAVMAYDVATFKGRLPEFAQSLRRSLEPAYFEMPLGFAVGAE